MYSYVRAEGPGLSSGRPELIRTIGVASGWHSLKVTAMATETATVSVNSIRMVCESPFRFFFVFCFLIGLLVVACLFVDSPKPMQRTGLRRPIVRF